jgi:hypothetical protein
MNVLQPRKADKHPETVDLTDRLIRNISQQRTHIAIVFMFGYLWSKYLVVVNERPGNANVIEVLKGI